jgi:serine/threonine protein kinase
MQSNIMVDASGVVKITDFGLTAIARAFNSLVSTSEKGGSFRWAAPEVLEMGAAFKESDVFSFGMVMIEVRDDQSTKY